MTIQLVTGLREEFCEVAESGYVYHYFGDETVNPLDAEEQIPAGATYKMNTEHCSLAAPVITWRGK